MAEPFLSILRKGEALPKKSFRRFLKSRDGGRLNALSKVTAVRFAVRGTDKADSFLKVFEMEEIEAA